MNNKTIIFGSVIGAFFIVLLALVFALQWPSLVERYPLVSDQPTEIDTSDWLTYRNDQFGYEIQNINPPLFDMGQVAWNFANYRHDFSFDRKTREFGRPVIGDILLTVYGVSEDVELGVIKNGKTDYQSYEDLIETWTTRSKNLDQEEFVSEKGVIFDIFTREPIDGIEDGYAVDAYTASENWLYKIELLGNSLEFVIKKEEKFLDFLNEFQLIEKS